MELSMAIAIVAAAAISEYFTALIITLFVLIAEVLEGMTVSRGRRAIRDLLDFMPRTVTVRRGDGGREISADALDIGDSVLVNPGAQVPVDGVVIGGRSFVDEARITGEWMAAEKLPGAMVYAGSINQSGALEIRADRIGRDTSFGKIIEAVEHAQRSQAPVQRIADRLAGYLVYFALIAAVLTFAITARYPLDHRRHHRGGRMRYRGWNSAGHSRRHRAVRASRCDRQGRPLPRDARASGHRRARQDRHADLRQARSRRV